VSITAAELIAKISVSGASTAKSEIEGMGGAVEGAGSKLGLLAGGVALAAGAALIGLGVKSTKMAGDWQASMTRLYTSAGELKGNLSMVSSGLLKMAVDVGTSTDQMAKGMYYVESAGFHGSQGLQVLKMAAMGAKAENADLGEVANAVTSALNSYGLKASDAASVTNTLIAAVGHGKMTMSDLAGAVSNVLPATSKFHISMIDTTAAIATMTMQGDDASSAATHLRQMILALESPAKAGASALKEIGLSSQQVSDSMKKSLPDTIQTITDDLGKKFPEGSTAYNTALKNIAGGSKQLLGLLETSGTGLTMFKNNVKDMTAQVKAGGNSIMGWSDIQNTFNFKISQAKAAVEAFAINVGTFLLPIAGKIVDAFTGTIQGIQNFGKYLSEVFHSLNLTEVKDAWNQFSTAIGHVEQAFGRLVGALNPVKGDFDPFAEMIGNLAKGGLSIVSTLLREAAGALNSLFPPMQKAHAAAAPLLDTFDRATGYFNKFKQSAAPLLDTFDRATAVFDKLKVTTGPLTDTFDRATAVFGKFGHAADQAGEAINPMKQVLDVILGLGRAAMNMSPLVNIIQGVARHGKELGEWWQASVIPALRQAEPGFKNLGQALAGLLPAFEQIAQSVHNNFQKAFDALLPVFKVAIPIIIQIAGAIANTLGGAIKFLTPYIVQATNEIGKFATQIIERVAPMIKQFLDQTEQGIQFFQKNWTTIWSALGPLLQGVWDQIKGIVEIAWSVVKGIILVGLDLMSGNWKQAWTDIQDMFKGIWEGIQSYLKGAWEIIQGIVTGGVALVKGLFQGLSDDLVGHSIVPDMINGIVSWFEQLPGRAMAAVQSLVSQVLGALSGLASSALSAGASIVNNVAAGITSGIGTVTSAIAGVAQAIADHLPHSPAKKGPLSKLNEFGVALVKTFADDITKNSPKAHDAAQHMAEQVASQLKAFPKDIATARLDGNTALVKSLEAARHQDELLMRDFKDELTVHGDKWSALHGIIFGGTAAKTATAGAVGSLATVSNGARAFVGLGGERLNFSGTGATGTVSGVSSGGSTSSTRASGQPIEININIDGKRVAKAVIPDIVALIRNGTGTLL
jgi:TP901 family phage tail tape measure protein